MGARLRSITLDCRDADALAAFYVAVLDWSIVDRDGAGWIQIAGDSDVRLNLQAEPAYRPPVWPAMSRQLSPLRPERREPCAYRRFCRAMVRKERTVNRNPMDDRQWT